ncbi:2-oxoacid:acceptor oxidoreductase family protein [Nocardioides sp.]|uniref:2-oxoacid:acceptor oxidoreductase family protein n=1 Tax=Nocardioides sp. TaxID=35761 RepID=UPI002EDA00D5
MFNVRFHGRGGQGVVTAAEMLSAAAFDMGLHGQAFPTFGSERTGAPVVSFCRIHDQPIGFHEPIAVPDALVIQDPTLLHVLAVLEGASPATFLLVNTSRSFAEIGLEGYVDWLAPGRAATLPATEMARDLLGRPMPNTALLGAFAALTRVVTIDAVSTAIRHRFTGVLPPAVIEANVQVATRAFEVICHV